MNINLRLLKNSISNTISQKFNKVNNKFYSKLKASNIYFEKIFPNKYFIKLH